MKIFQQILETFFRAFLLSTLVMIIWKSFFGFNLPWIIVFLPSLIVIGFYTLCLALVGLICLRFIQKNPAILILVKALQEKKNEDS